MDLGIAGKKALVCGASKGLGFACAQALAKESVDVTLVARTESTLRQAAATIQATAGGRVDYVVADVTTAEGRERVLQACSRPDILVTNAAGPPPGNFREWSIDDWSRALNDNMLSSIELIRMTIDGMIQNRFGRIVNITSSAVKAPIPALGLSNGARAGLTGFVAGLAREVVQHNVTVNNLLPGFFDTDRLRNTLDYLAKQASTTLEDYRQEHQQTIPALRYGKPEEFGMMCASMCSAHAGYLTGQNILLDGGFYPGTF
ncbi:SDR family oxidoreductase [Advenella alkanexedens]|uniref:SDR family oxidoreductase n=1 Tax=Advenella alkanexedens TaxID=1481665 RepID=A0ABS6NLH3_9BURK|nr:SDR family oxidoreductase [Advenella alkanexedens]MBV4396481.1 SDR family oxidoreductase [Advenella alkanexedens]